MGLVGGSRLGEGGSRGPIKTKDVVNVEIVEVETTTINMDSRKI